MFDDEPHPDPYHLDANDDEPARGLRAYSCLFLIVTLLLIVSLAGSSLLAYFLIDRSSRSSSADQVRNPISEEQPTAAPATVAALSDSSPTEEAGIEPTSLA
jgi:hypothetical protein